MPARPSYSFFVLLVLLALAVSGCSAHAAATPTAAPPTLAPEVAATEAPVATMAAAPLATAAEVAQTAEASALTAMPMATAELTSTAAAGAQAALNLALTSMPTLTVPAQTPAAQASAPSGAPTDALSDAYLKQQQQSYRATMVSTNASGTTRTMVMEYSPPGNMHMTMPGGSEIIMLTQQGAIYQKRAGSAAWTQMPSQIAQAVMTNIPLPFLGAKQLAQFKQMFVVNQTNFAGFGAVGATPALIYNYTTTLAANQNAHSTGQMWIGVADGLPLKVQSTGTGAGGGGPTTTVITYQYDPSIQVQAPQ